MAKRVLMIAGPNGAGKTTTAKLLTKNSTVLYEFINADEIARGLAPLHPESVAVAASKLMLKRMHELLNAGKSFAFETTASGSNYIKHLKTAKENGYEFYLVYLWLRSPEYAINRVAQRVKQGGHYVPEEIIIRRYYSGMKNFFTHYLPLSDQALILDNSGEQERIIAIKNKNRPIDILDEVVWKKIERGLNDG